MFTDWWSTFSAPLCIVKQQVFTYIRHAGAWREPRHLFFLVRRTYQRAYIGGTDSEKDKFSLTFMINVNKFNLLSSSSACSDAFVHLKMRQTAFAAGGGGSAPDPAWGSSQPPLDPLAGYMGRGKKEEKENRRERVRRRKEREGREGGKREGEGRACPGS